MRYYECLTELEAMRTFYQEIYYTPEQIDYDCSTDGRIILDAKTGLKGSLIEFKLTRKPNKDVFNQMKRYIKAYNSKAKDLPKYGVYIITTEQKYTVFDLEAEKVEDAIIVENLDLTINSNDFSCSADQYLKNTYTQKGWIDETSIVAYNDAYFSSKGKAKKKKDDFIAELANPTLLNIKPYIWNESGNMERKLLDCLGSSELKKRLGAFFTPDSCVRKTTEYVRNIIKNLKDDEDYIIVDRCAGTGNLEKFFSDEELSHCILNTLVYAEKLTLKGLYEGRVKAILPTIEDIDDNGCMLIGDALQEPFNKVLSKTIELLKEEASKNGKKLVVIGLENPPYAEPQAEATRSGKTVHGTSENYISREAKKDKVNGITMRDLSNKFIWSGFKYYYDYYVVYSPIKYWKSQHLVDKKFLEGSIANRKDFHATEAGISIISWKNEDSTNNELVLENCTVKKISKKCSENLPANESNGFVYITTVPPTPDFKNGLCLNSKPGNTGKYATLKLCNENNIKQAMPLFAANCYTCKDYKEKEIIMKSADMGLAYMNDTEFLEDCFLWTCLTDKNKCLSNGTLINETAISQNSKADQLINLMQPHRLNLKRSWDMVLNEAKKCSEYNSNFKYGLAQIEEELNIEISSGIADKRGKILMNKKYPKLDEQIKSFKESLNVFYDTYISPKCFKYELLK